MRSVVFVPVFNEINHFPTVLEEIKAGHAPADEVLLVNNGSTDGSEDVVRGSGFPYVDLPINRGVGYSFIRALDWALDHGFDVFATMAGNGKMIPAQLPRVLGPVLAGEADFVKGSRYLPGGEAPNLPAFRRRAIPWVNRFVRVVTGRSVTDSSCGFRSFRLDLLRAATFDWHREWMFSYGFEYYFDAKILLDRRIRFREVPVTMRYKAGIAHSKIRGVQDWYAMLKPWVLARIDRRGFNFEQRAF